MLSVQSVTKTYGNTTALDSATFDVEAGEVLAVVGSNGAGKSTLIKAVIGLIHYSGEVFVDGISARRKGKAARARLGYLPQNPIFHHDLTVRETALFYAQLRRATPDAARSLIESVGLAEHAEKQVGALSGGMRQRLALAVAQLGDPPLLMLDEPATGLDVSARLELRQFIRAQRVNGKAIVLSTHWLEDVPSIADSVLVLDAGRTAFHGSAKQWSAREVARSQLHLRLNGSTSEAIPLIQSAGHEVSLTGDWLSISLPASEKARVLEALMAAGITIHDFRVEDAVPSAELIATQGGEQ